VDYIHRHPHVRQRSPVVKNSKAVGFLPFFVAAAIRLRSP